MHKVMHGKAWWGTSWAKFVRHTPDDQNMLTKFNQGYTQKIGTHLSPNQLKNATWAFWQTHGM